MGFLLCLCSTDDKEELAFRSKLVHNWLHLGHRRKHLSHSHHTTTVIQLCPMCSSPEDFQHFLTCKSPRALKIRYEASARLTKSLRDFPNLGSLLHAISEWTLDPTTLLSPSTISDTKVAVAITNQSHIGWANLFRGFISADWGCLTVPDDADKNEASDKLQILRLALTIRALQDYSLALWTGRNTILHEHSAHSLSIVNAALNYDISQMYALRASLSDHLGSYFQLPLTARLQQSPRQRKRWLRLARLATSHASSSGQSQQHISLYFPYVERKHLSQSCTAAPPLHERISEDAPPVLQQSTIQSYFRSATVTASPGVFSGSRPSTVRTVPLSSSAPSFQT